MVPIVSHNVNPAQTFERKPEKLGVGDTHWNDRHYLYNKAANPVEHGRTQVGKRSRSSSSSCAVNCNPDHESKADTHALFIEAMLSHAILLNARLTFYDGKPKVDDKLTSP